MFNIVLFSPKIPYNTGAIGRLCVNTDTTLHLVKPLGFNIDEKSIKKSGLDYWNKVSLKIYNSTEHFFSENRSKNIYFFTTKANSLYFNTTFDNDDYFVFGSEDRGISNDILDKYYDKTLTIPMGNNGRSLNLAICVGVVLYEAIRQNY